MAAFGLGGFGDMRGPGGLAALGFGGASRGFEEQYHCYPVSFQDKQHLEGGDKILLPSSALDALARQQVEYPMLFEISNPAVGNRTHCGVLEFSAPEGSCYIPHWMMQNLLLEAGSLLTVKNVSLPKGIFVKFKPQSVDFLEISNPRAVLETTMRQYSCLTAGDVICIPYNDRNYYLEVKELKPADAVGIVETDLNVDFDEPVGYAEAQAAKNGAGSGGATGAIGPHSMSLPAPASGKAVKAAEKAPAFVPFAGKGVRVDEKKTPSKKEPAGSPGSGSGQGASASSTRAAAAAAAAEARASAGPNGGAAPAGRAGIAIKAQPGKWSKSKKLQAGAFQGSGNRMS